MEWVGDVGEVGWFWEEVWEVGGEVVEGGGGYVEDG